MVNVDRLLGVRGDARGLLGSPMNAGVDWSDAYELSRAEVIRGVRFDGFSLSRAKVGLDFVECRFSQCAFKDLEVDGHFWGAGDRWMECDFEGCRLHRMIAPVNSFERCRFDRVEVVNFQPHQTLFEGCSFSRSTIDGLKAHLISNGQIVNHDLRGDDGQLLFRNCRFEGTSFRRCYFEGVAFESCQFENTEASECSFEGVVSDVRWWGAQEIDPFTVFLTQALDLIGTKCGRDSAAYREFETYVIDYRSGKTRDKNFSASLYNNRVPYAETQMVIKELRKRVALHPF